MLNNLKLTIIRKLASLLIVNVVKNPEHLSADGKSCSRNYYVAQIFEAVDSYRKEIQAQPSNKPEEQS